jgi:hypothetical protein
MATAIEELQGLLRAAAGEPTGSFHSHLGRWRQKVSQLLGQIINNSGGSAAGPIEYVQVGFLTTDTSGTVPSGPGQVGTLEGGDVIFNGDVYGNIPYSVDALGVFTLSPNKTYYLSASLQLGYSDPDAFATIYWVEATTNQPLRNGVGAIVDGGYEALQYSGVDTGQLIITVGAEPLLVKVRVLSITSTSIDILYGSNAAIHEIR